MCLYMQGYKTLEISQPSELHVKAGKLQINQNEQTFSVPIEDLTTVVCIGSGIRLSTMALSQLAENGVLLMALDSSYHPSYVVTPVESNARQSRAIHKQIGMSDSLLSEIWQLIVKSKIDNQARTLSILGLPGADKVGSYATSVDEAAADHCEAAAAKDYFTYFHPGLNRRTDDPMNSRLNYGYAVLRNAIIREIMLAGLHPALGVHHNSQLNAFNLADDLIEPWRPMADLVAHENVGAQVLLNKSERRELANVLHNACIIDGCETSVQSGINLMVAGYKRCVFEGKSSPFRLPTVKPIELINEIKE